MKLFKYLTIGLLAFSNLFVVQGQMTAEQGIKSNDLSYKKKLYDGGCLNHPVGGEPKFCNMLLEHINQQEEQLNIGKGGGDGFRKSQRKKKKSKKKKRKRRSKKRKSKRRSRTTKRK